MSNAKSWQSKDCKHEEMRTDIVYDGDGAFEIDIECEECTGSNNYYLPYGEMLGGIALELVDCEEVCIYCAEAEAKCDCHTCGKCEESGENVTDAECYECGHVVDLADCDCASCEIAAIILKGENE